MIALYIIVGYIAMIFAFCLWDTWIGMPVDWNADGPLGFAACFWPVAIPVVAIIAFDIYIDKAKQNRKNKEVEKQRRGIAEQKEIDRIWQEILDEAKGIGRHERKS